MPEISRFFGITIRMFHSEHGPPHIHAAYGEFVVSVEIETGIVHGDFPPRGRKLVLEWTVLRRPELMDNWRRAREGKPLERIAPLE